MRVAVSFALAFTLSLTTVANAQTTATVESNVVYGMYSGLALLMDVHRPPPDTSNGYGVIFIQGCGWHQPLTANADPLKGLKEGPAVTALAKPLAEHGFTVFTVNHRMAPRFRYPAALEDAQRAVQYVRHHHQQYGISRDRIAAVGGSSGGHLALLLGLLPSAAKRDAGDLIERESSKVQSVVAIAPATDFLADDFPPITAGVHASFLGEPRFPNPAPEVFKVASPISHAAGGAAPILLIHGDEDTVVPCTQSRKLYESLKENNAVAKYIEVEKVGHGIPPLVASGKEDTDPAAIASWILSRLAEKR